MAGFHAQVKVADGMSLLFLISEVDGDEAARVAAAVCRGVEGRAREHSPQTDLLARCFEKLSRNGISPNALLRPVFQDTILPVAAYVGGPAEIAYWAQSAVIYERVLGSGDAGAAAADGDDARARDCGGDGQG